MGWNAQGRHSREISRSGGLEGQTMVYLEERPGENGKKVDGTRL